MLALNMLSSLNKDIIIIIIFLLYAERLFLKAGVRRVGIVMTNQW